MRLFKLPMIMEFIKGHMRWGIQRRRMNYQRQNTIPALVVGHKCVDISIF